ncbi:MAG: RagB/SusD family nutrient uptake outer membrane protein, partial [Prevotellaceae bacterium]|nr:RagB/SusD family nutrient uptake outer membrane protein [Prevotellaceae bacterium]
MKRIYQNRKSALLATMLISLLCGSIFFVSCSRDFLKPDPLSFYEPTTTFSTESGLQAALAMADRHLRTYWTYWENVSNSLPIGTEYMISELTVYGKTDVAVNNVNFDIAAGLTPTGGAAENANDGNYINYFWGQTYTGIK